MAFRETLVEKHIPRIIFRWIDTSYLPHSRASNRRVSCCRVIRYGSDSALDGCNRCTEYGSRFSIVGNRQLALMCSSVRYASSVTNWRRNWSSPWTIEWITDLLHVGFFDAWAVVGWFYTTSHEWADSNSSRHCGLDENNPICNKNGMRKLTLIKVTYMLL